MSGSHPRMRLALVATVGLLVSGLAWLHAVTFMDTFNAPRAIALPAHAPDPPAHQAPHGRRVVLVIVDGLAARRASHLGLDVPPPRQLPEARCILETGWPSYSRPSWVTIASGAPPQLSGVHVNGHRGPAPVESVFDVARAAGLHVDALTDAVTGFFELYPNAWRDRVADAELFRQRHAGLFGSSDAHLTLVHTDTVDTAGHDHGAASSEYAAAAANVGERLRQLRGRLDPTRDTLLVTADHGHLPGGGHGGPEHRVRRVELYAAGYGIAPQRGPACAARQRDIAPTVAALLGLRPPGHASGRAIEALLDPAVIDPTAVAERTTRQHARLARALGEPDGDLEAVLPGWRRPAAGPIALAAVLWMALLAFMSMLAPSVPGGKRERAGPWIAALGCPAVFTVGHAVMEPTLSFSSVNPDKWAWLLRMLVLAAAAIAASLPWGRALARPEGPGRRIRRGALTLALSALPLFVAAGIHGSLRGGPLLGETHAAHAMLVGDVLLGVVGAWVALELLLTTLRRPRRDPGAASDP